MITGKPDPMLSPDVLEQEIQAFCRDIGSRENWFSCEKYVDRGPMDPFYILLFTQQVEDSGDDLKEEPLFAARNPALKVKRMTRLPGDNAADRSYWKPILSADLVRRLLRFMDMYNEDYLQPPGFHGDLYNPGQEHPRFPDKRFLYQVGPFKKPIIGVGSRKFAPIGFGAVCGKLCDEKGNPLEGVTIELISNLRTIKRITGVGGFFWFSRLSPGKYRIQVSGKGCVGKVNSIEAFGEVRGQISDYEQKPLGGVEIQMKAPDEEIFKVRSSASGKFVNWQLPGFHYTLGVPGYLFTATLG